MMSITGNQVDEYRGTAIMGTTVYSPDELVAHKRERSDPSFLDSIVGRRGGLRSILTQVEAVAPTNATILIAGETGAGKEVIARTIHELSPRRGRNPVNHHSPSLPARLLYS